MTFAYSDWVSGWRQDSSAFYGRPWTVVYGALSQYPEATLAFTLEGPVTGGAVLEVTGLDDEWAGNCEIQVFVNGTGVYQGPSPWLSYSGNASDFSDAQWSTASLSIPAEMLRAGDNTIEIHNLEHCELRIAAATSYLPRSTASGVPGRCDCDQEVKAATGRDRGRLRCRDCGRDLPRKPIVFFRAGSPANPCEAHSEDKPDRPSDGLYTLTFLVKVVTAPVLEN